MGRAVRGNPDALRGAGPGGPKRRKSHLFFRGAGLLARVGGLGAQLSAWVFRRRCARFGDARAIVELQSPPLGVQEAQEPARPKA
jgi:hypothetical protein